MNATDYALFALWALVIVFNRAAIVPLFILCVFTLSFCLLDSSFAINIITAIAYFQLAPVNIRLSSEIRHAMLAFGALYLLGAVDDLLYYQLDISTAYHASMPYIVIALNAYIAALLMRDRRRTNAGITSALARCWHRLRYGI
jgi:hypothetical protein